MELMNQLDKNDVREFFSKGWMTHDAMWFYHCIKEFGPEKANRLNQAAVKSMAGIEIQRIMKLMGKEKSAIKTFDELTEIIDTTFKLIKPEFMKLYYSFPEKNKWVGGFHECFAYEGMKKIGMVGNYQCGIVLRLQGWFESLGLAYTMKPPIDGCLMNTSGKCEVEFIFNLD